MSTEALINLSLQSFGGLISLMILLCLSFYKGKKSQLDRLYVHVLFCHIILQFCNSFTWLLDARPGKTVHTFLILAYFGMFFFSYFIIIVFAEYMAAYLAYKGAKVRHYVWWVWAIVGFGILLLVISQFNHMLYSVDSGNLYVPGRWYWVTNALGIVAEIPILLLLVRNRRSLSVIEFVVFSSYLFIPFVAMSMLIFTYGEPAIYIATSLVVIGVYIFIQSEQARQSSEQELELERAKIAVMLSQIQPHFLYNSLTGIKELCDSGEQQATSEALEHFAYYLRGNMSSLTSVQLISFSQEVSHVRDYLHLEKMRFGERFHVVWELAVTDFFLPPLTLQPIVENAVRHGITEKKGGGTLTIRSEQCNAGIMVSVMDDGVGFDVTQHKEDGRTHVGIANVKSRLERQCDGTLIIESVPGSGTVVRIFLQGMEVKRDAHRSSGR